MPKFALVKSAIPTLYQILQIESDLDILSDTAWALSYLSDKEGAIDYALARRIISTLIKHLDCPFLAVLVPSIRILGNITQDDTVQSIALENSDYLPALFKLTCHNNRSIRRESCWNISNITAGTAEQSKAITDHHYYVDILIKIATTDLLEVKREALYALVNPIDNWTQKQLTELLDLGVLDCFICLLNSAEGEIIELAIQGILKILTTESSLKRNNGVEILRARGTAKIIEGLQSHQKAEISSVASDILMKYFDTETDES